MRVALYTRISTDEDRQPFSLGAQEERLRAYVASQENWQVVAHYSDQASGFKIDRPALFVAEVRTGGFAVGGAEADYYDPDDHSAEVSNLRSPSIRIVPRNC